MEKPNDPIHRPLHYEGSPDGPDCKAAMRSMLFAHKEAGATADAIYWAGCALKYLWRYCSKNGEQDLDKAIECIGQVKAAQAGATRGAYN